MKNAETWTRYLSQTLNLHLKQTAGGWRKLNLLLVWNDTRFFVPYKVKLVASGHNQFYI